MNGGMTFTRPFVLVFFSIFPMRAPEDVYVASTVQLYTSK